MDNSDEAALLARLAMLVREKRLRLSIDRTMLGHIDFPLAVEADANRWLYALIAVAALTFWQFGMMAGLAVCAASLLLYFTLGKNHVARRLELRVRERGLASVETWRRLWRFGGVILTEPDGTAHRGPDESWMELVRSVTSRLGPSRMPP